MPNLGFSTDLGKATIGTSTMRGNRHYLTIKNGTRRSAVPNYSPSKPTTVKDSETMQIGDNKRERERES